MNKTAKFNIGEVVLHKKQGYRAIIVDIDPFFQATTRHHLKAHQKKFKHIPWYRLLVDNTSLVTYVEESLLQAVPGKPLAFINHPSLGRYLKKNNGRYMKNTKPH